MSILSLILRRVDRRVVRSVSSSDHWTITPRTRRTTPRNAFAQPSFERLEDRLLLTGTLGVDAIAQFAIVGHGGNVQYNYNVTFTPSGQPADPTAAIGASISVIDNRCGAATPTVSGSFNVGDADSDNLLDSGETWSYRCTFQVAAHAAGETNPIVNTATVTGNDSNGNAAASGMDMAAVTIVHDAGTLTISKISNVSSVAHGGTVTYTLDVTYAPGADGSPAQNIVVTDPQCAAGTLTGPNTSTAVDPDNDADALLETSETWRYTCTFTVPATHAAGEEDPILNVATVTGRDLDGDVVAGDTSNQVSVDLLHGAISGRKFNDRNGDGLGTGDPGRNGVTITLFRDANGNGTLDTTTDTLVNSQQTAASGGQDGRYSFGSLLPGTYFVQETVPTGSTQTAPVAPGTYTVIIAADETVSDRDFGNFVNITISGHKFLDLNNNGDRDDDEPGLEDWQIFLDADGDGTLDDGERNTLTDADGDYSFTNLGPGTYTVREVLQAGWRRTSDNPAAATASSGQNAADVDFGNLPLGDAMLVENPETGEMDLLVTGTAEPDRIFVRRGQPNDAVDVHINGAAAESFQPTGRIIVQTFEGDDLAQISRHIRLSAHIDAGAGADIVRGGGGDDLLMGQDGDDRLFGRPGDDMLRAGDGEDRVRAGRGDDIVLGEEGDDVVRGARGRDLLIGGEGADVLKGDNEGPDGNDNDHGGHGRQKNQDILIGGTTDHDDTDEALQAILAEWTSARSYEVRVDNLRDGTGSATSENDHFFLDPTTVLDDDEVDRLIGSIGRDWFFALEDGESSDQLADQRDREFVDELV